MKWIPAIIVAGAFAILIAMYVYGQGTGTGMQPVTGPGIIGAAYEEGDLLLLETGDYILLETGDKIILE